MKKAFPPLIDSNSRILLLGTMPGEKSLELGEYYGNRGNQFWKLIFAVLEKELSHNYNEKKGLLLQNQIALWDVLEYCERMGSLDSNIKNEKINDFKHFYKKYPNIKHVFFSSKNAAVYYDKYVRRREGINYETLPSPSGANASMPYSEKLKVWTEKIRPLIF